MKLSAWFGITLSLLALLTMAVNIWLRSSLLRDAALTVAMLGILFSEIRRRRLHQVIAVRQDMIDDHCAGVYARLAEIRGSAESEEEGDRLCRELMKEDQKFWDNLPRLDVL